MKKNKSQQQTPSGESYKRWYQRRCLGGKWFVCFDDYLEIMTIEQAWVLQRIINAGAREPRHPKQRELWRQGWILCTVDYLRRKTKLSPDAQERVLRALQGKKTNGAIDHERVFIHVQRFGAPPRRYIMIDTVAIENAIDLALENGNASKAPNTAKSRDSNTAKSRHSLYRSTYPKKDKRKNPCRGAAKRRTRDGERAQNNSAPKDRAAPQPTSAARAKTNWPETEPSPALRRSFSQRCADYLQQALRCANLLKRRCQPQRWAREFDKLLAALARSKDAPDTKDIEKEVEVVLHDHCAHLGDRFQPQLYSAASFCLRYEAAVAARERRQQAQGEIEAKEQGRRTRPDFMWDKRLVDVPVPGFKNRVRGQYQKRKLRLLIDEEWIPYENGAGGRWCQVRERLNGYEGDWIAAD